MKPCEHCSAQLSRLSMIDSFGRRVNYLRLSVTDRCNMRCLYCMPPQGVNKLPRQDILSYDELYRIASAAVDVGVRKIRVTGGEPLVRKGISTFLARLAGIPGLKQLVLTTNGYHLEEMAGELLSAGVQRLNISLDSLQKELFAHITRGGDLSRVLAGIAAAEHAGFPVKINMVVMRGINDTEIIKFATLAMLKPYTVRFIEYMPVIKESNWQSLVVPGHEILARIAMSYSFEPISCGELAGPAQEYRINGALGAFGIITPVSGHFCGNCNRIRVTSTGMAKNCLFSSSETDLKPYVKAPDMRGLREALCRMIVNKPGKHQLSSGQAEHPAFAMATVGG